MRDLPTLVWLVLLVAAAAFHRWLPMPGWLLLHLLFLGVATHSILVWSQHFSFALTRSRHTHAARRSQNLRLILGNLGAVLVLIGVPTPVLALTVAGAALIVTAVIWHGLSIWRRLRGALPGHFTRTLRYYLASAAFLPVGVVLGVWIATPASSGGLVLAHALTNLLGWIGLTVAGTVVTLWPTMLRTRAATSAAREAARALPILAAGVAVAALGAALGFLPVLAVGLLAYASGLSLIGVSLGRAARNAPPSSYASLSVAAALLWWFGSTVGLAVIAIVAWLAGGGPGQLRSAMDWLAPYLAAGFVAQVILGALSYLIPVALGGGPGPVRIGTAAFDRGAALRVAAANTALFVCVLPVSSVIRVAASLVYLVAMASFLPIFVIGLRAQRRAKAAAGTGLPGHAGLPGPAGQPGKTQAGQPAQTTQAAPAGAVQPAGATAEAGPLEPPPGARRAGQAMAGLLAVILVAAVGGALAPHSLGSVSGSVSGLAASSGGAGSDAEAPVQRVSVSAADMRFTPDRIDVPAGTRLVIELTNTDDEQPHDLVFANGAGGQRLAPGDSTTIDVGVITEDLEGWCSIIGHREMGMTLDIVATGTGTGTDTSTHSGDDSGAGPTAPGAHNHSNTAGSSAAADDGSAAGLVDLMSGDLGENFQPVNAVLSELPAASGPVVHTLTMPVTELDLAVAPGAEGPVSQRLWTFGGTAPGPVLHGRVGDRFEITLVNDGTIGHSIDFHAGSLAPDEPMRTIAPGDSLTYTFTATRAGIWMYHCATMPMSAHIANGMFGAVIIEPTDLPPVDRSYVLVQSEYYLGAEGGEVDVEKIAAEQPDLVVFNGVAAQYERDPLPARVGERVRVWLLDAGPNRATSFHVIGGQFDTVWAEGAFLLDRSADTGSQALALQPAQGGYVELVFPEAGNYPFVSHLMVDAERGASGLFAVDE